MKKIIFSFLLIAAISSHAAGDPEVNQEVAKAFKETFIYAEDVNWRKTGSDFQADFWQGAVNVSADYDEWGNLLRTIRHYFEKQLPPLIVAKIKKEYTGRTILFVTEVSSEDDITYYVSLQDDKHIYSIKVSTFGSIHQISRYLRADY
jgi:hypothetical protein